MLLPIYRAGTTSLLGTRACQTFSAASRVIAACFGLLLAGLNPAVAAPPAPTLSPADKASAIQAHLDQAAADEKKADDAGAIAEINAAITLAPQEARFWRIRGEAYAGSQQYHQALADETYALSLDPKDAQAYFDRGIAYERLGDIDRAITETIQAVALKPISSRTHYRLGQLYDQRAFFHHFRAGEDQTKADRDQAIAEFTRAIDLLPNISSEAAFALAEEYEKEGDTDRALAEYTQMLALYPGVSVVVYKRRAQIYERKFDYNHAIIEYTLHINANPNDPLLSDTYCSRGVAYLRKGDYDEQHRGPDTDRAIADFTYAIDANKTGTGDALTDDAIQATAYANRAVAYERKGDAGKAAQDRAEADILNKRLKAKTELSPGIVVTP